MLPHWRAASGRTRELAALALGCGCRAAPGARARSAAPAPASALSGGHRTAAVLRRVPGRAAAGAGQRAWLPGASGGARRTAPIACLAEHVVAAVHRRATSVRVRAGRTGDAIRPTAGAAV